MSEYRGEQLVSLFKRVFEGSSLVRFVRKNYGTRFARITAVKGLASSQIRAIVDEFFDHDLVDDRLFDLLLDESPDNAKLINRVRGEYTEQGGGSAEPEEADPDNDRDEDLGDERRAWRDKLKRSLEARVTPVPELPMEWIRAAAVLPDFNPVKLKPFAPHGDAGGGLVALAAYCDTRFDGRWELALRHRREALQALWSEQAIEDALDCNPHEESPHASLLRMLSQTNPLPFDAIANYPTLLAAIDIDHWLADVDELLFDVDRVHAAVERYERIEPLRRLVGTHFRGRDDVLQTLAKHSHGEPEDDSILIMWGIGGAGKSTILGKHLLDIDSQSDLPRPWAYVDFDDPKIDPTNHFALMEQIARHLGLLYTGTDIAGAAVDPEAATNLESAYLSLEGIAADEDLRVEFSVDMASAANTRSLVESLAEATHALPMEPSLLLVFDTFEQVQVRGRYAVQRVRELIDEILDVMPFARIVVSGRGNITDWRNTHTLKVGDLDEESADQVMIALGVDKPDARNTVIQKLGTNPLTLRLVADGIKAGRLSDEDLDKLVVGARSIRMQGHLYTRILGHIRDGEIRRLTHPGLVVRRVSSGVIADVLSEICEIHPDRIDDLLDRLPHNVSLFEPDDSMPNEGPALKHRQDVRETMLALMVEDPAWRSQLERIHDLAVQHYSQFDHRIAQAEELYHRIMRDDEPAAIDPLWSDEIAASIARSWDEPLPQRARLWLGARIGRLDELPEAELRHVDKELDIAREARAYMQSKDYGGALKQLTSIAERSAGSPLFALEAKALSGLNRHDDAYAAAMNGLEVADEARYPRRVMELHRLAAAAAMETADYDAVVAQSDEAVRIANSLDDTNAFLELLDLRVRATKAQGDAQLAESNAMELENVFLNADERELRSVPNVSGRVINTLGAGSPNVLRKAALTFGNREKQTVINQDVFQLEQLLERTQMKDSAKGDLTQLATQVGLPAQKFEMVDLAGPPSATVEWVTRLPWFSITRAATRTFGSKRWRCSICRAT